MLRKRCIICGKHINRGIMINGRYMCESCEKRLMNLDVYTDFYEYYKKRIRKCFKTFSQGGEDENCQDYQ